MGAVGMGFGNCPRSVMGIIPNKCPCCLWMVPWLLKRLQRNFVPPTPTLTTSLAFLTPQNCIQSRVHQSAGSLPSPQNRTELQTQFAFNVQRGFLPLFQLSFCILPPTRPWLCKHAGVGHSSIQNLLCIIIAYNLFQRWQKREGLHSYFFILVIQMILRSQHSVNQPSYIFFRQKIFLHGENRCFRIAFAIFFSPACLIDENICFRLPMPTL